MTKKKKNYICLPGEILPVNRRALLRNMVTMTAYYPLAKLTSATTAMAQSASGVQKNLVWINMRGGWDILEVLDPKRASTSGIDMIYDWGQAHSFGSSDDKVGRWLPNIASIGNDLLVVRGIAMGTTSHNAGSTYMETGVLSNSGDVNAASIPAIVASEGQATIPIIQLNGGGDPMIDRGLLNPVSVVRANNLDLYRSMYPTSSEEIQKKLKMLDYVQGSFDRLQSAVGTNDRLSGAIAAQEKIRKQFENDVGTKLALSSEEEASFMEGAPTTMRGGAGNSFALTAKLINEGIVNCVNLGMGGFDTHSNQTRSLQPTLESFDFLLGSLVSSLRASGKLDSTLIVVYSDFGRTPKINNSNGRDHWPVGGALMIGGGIDGGRAVGATDDDLRALWVNKDSGSIETSEGSGDSIVQMSPIHLGGSVLDLTLGTDYLQYRPYLESLPILTKLKSS